MQKFLRKPAVAEAMGWSERTLDRYVSLGKFPRPFKTSERAVAWLEKDVIDWQKAIIAAAGREWEEAA